MTDKQDLHIEKVAIERLQTHPRNYRRGHIESIMDSLRRFGQVKPIVVWNNTVVAGNHTLKAAQELGWNIISVVKPQLTEDEALAYLAADNRTSDLATNDDAALVAILEELQNKSSLEGTGYTADDVDDILASLDRIEETDVQPFKGDYAEDPEVTAARWENREEGKHREVVFLLEHEKFEDFRDKVTKLKRKYGTESMAEAVYLAVCREAVQTTVEDFTSTEAPAWETQ